MSIKTTTIIHCDQCEKKIGMPYGALLVQITGQHELVTQFEQSIERQFCSFNCLSKWASGKIK